MDLKKYFKKSRHHRLPESYINVDREYLLGWNENNQVVCSLYSAEKLFYMSLNNSAECYLSQKPSWGSTRNSKYEICCTFYKKKYWEVVLLVQTSNSAKSCQFSKLYQNIKQPAGIYLKGGTEFTNQLSPVG